MRNLFKTLGLYIAAAAVALHFAPGSAFAQAQLFHFSMESVDDSKAQLYTKDGGSAIAVPGKYGKALQFTGQALLATPFNLDYAEYPQITVTAWVRQPDGTNGVRAIFANGSSSGYRIQVSTVAAVKAGRSGVSFSGPRMQADEWVFVAGVVDTSAGWARLHQAEDVFSKRDIDTRTKSPRKFSNPDNPEAEKEYYVFIGGNNFYNWGSTSRTLAIDEIRVYAGALSEEEVAAIRDGGVPTPEIAQIVGETEKNLESPTLKSPVTAKLPGDQFDPRFLPGDQFTCAELSTENYTFAELPGDQFDSALLPGDQFEAAALPGDQFVCDRLPGDQFESAMLPGDQFEETKLPGDQFVCASLPGDQFACKALPGDQFDLAELPGDQFRCGALPGDQFETSGFACAPPGERQFPDNPPFIAPGGSTEIGEQDGRPVGQVADIIGTPEINAPEGAPVIKSGSQTAGSHSESGTRAETNAEEALVASRQRSRGVTQSAETEEISDQQQALATAGKPRPVGDRKYSAISGYQGQTTFVTSLETEFLNRIDWGERNDKPCSIGLNLDPSTSYSPCFLGKSPKESSKLFVSVNEKERLIAVGSIEVCSSFNQNNRLKGIRIVGDWIKDDGSMVYAPEAISQASHPNCSDWHPAVLCPSGTLATGVIAHANSSGRSGFEFVGLQLICRAVGVE